MGFVASIKAASVFLFSRGWCFRHFTCQGRNLLFERNVGHYEAFNFQVHLREAVHRLIRLHEGFKILRVFRLNRYFYSSICCIDKFNVLNVAEEAQVA